MKKLILLSILLSSSVALASQPFWNIEDFQKQDLFNQVEVTEAEMVFHDELLDESLYEVTFQADGECSSGGIVNSCEDKKKPFCEFVWVVNQDDFVDGTNVSCDQGLQEVLKPTED